jgi:hypothetical protein
MMPILLCVAVVLVLVLCIAGWMRSCAEFRERFPPISDAEFLARCPPGTNLEVALKVRRIVADHFAIEYERVHPSGRFIEDFGAD